MQRLSSSRLATLSCLAFVLGFALFLPHVARAAPPSVSPDEIWLSERGHPAGNDVSGPITITNADLNTTVTSLDINVADDNYVDFSGANSFNVASNQEGDTVIEVQNNDGLAVLDVHVGLSSTPAGSPTFPPPGSEPSSVINISPPGGWGDTAQIVVNHHYGPADVTNSNGTVATVQPTPGPGPELPAGSQQTTLVVTGVAVGQSFLSITNHPSQQQLHFLINVTEEEPGEMNSPEPAFLVAGGQAIEQGGRLDVFQFTVSGNYEGAADSTLEWIHLTFADAPGITDGMTVQVNPDLYDGNDIASEIRRVIVWQVAPGTPNPNSRRWYWTLYEIDDPELRVSISGNISVDLKVDIPIPPSDSAATWEVIIETSSLAKGFELPAEGHYRDRFTVNMAAIVAEDIAGSLLPPPIPDQQPPNGWTSPAIHVVSAVYDATPTGPFLAVNSLGVAEPRLDSPTSKEYPIRNIVFPGIGVRPRFDFFPTAFESFSTRLEAREVMPQEQQLAVLAIDLQGRVPSPETASTDEIRSVWVGFEEIDPTGLENTFDPLTAFSINLTPTQQWNPITVWVDNGDGVFDPATDLIQNTTQGISWVTRPFDLDGDNQMEYYAQVTLSHPTFWNLQGIDDLQPDYFVVIIPDSGQLDQTGFDGDRRPLRFGTDFTAFVRPYVYDYNIDPPEPEHIGSDDGIPGFTPEYVLPGVGTTLTGVRFSTWQETEPLTALSSLESTDVMLGSSPNFILRYIPPMDEYRFFVGNASVSSPWGFPCNEVDPLTGWPGRLWQITTSINDDLVKPISLVFDTGDTVASTSRYDPSQFVGPWEFSTLAGRAWDFFMLPINPDPHLATGTTGEDISQFDQRIDVESPPTSVLSLTAADLITQGSIPGAVGEQISRIRVNLRGGVGELLEDIDEDDTEFFVRSTRGFSRNGSLQIGGEIMSYANIPEMYLATDLKPADTQIWLTMDPELCDYLFPGKTPQDKFNEFPDSGYVDVNGEIIFYANKGAWSGPADGLMSYGILDGIVREVYGNRPRPFKVYPETDPFDLNTFVVIEHHVYTAVKSLQIQGAVRGAGITRNPETSAVVNGTEPTEHLTGDMVACATPTDLAPLSPGVESGISFWIDNKAVGNVGTFDPIVDYMIDTDGTTSRRSNFNPVNPQTDDVVPGFGGGAVQGTRFRTQDRILFDDRDGDNEYSLGETLFYDSNGDEAFTAGVDEIILDTGFGIQPRPAFLNAGGKDVRRILFIDVDGDGRYDDGEDIFYDGDLDGSYDIPIDRFVRLDRSEIRWRFDQEYDADNDGIPEGIFFTSIDPTEGIDVSNFDRFNGTDAGPDFFICIRTSDTAAYNDRIQLEIPDYDQLDGRIPVVTPPPGAPLPDKLYERGFIYTDVSPAAWPDIPIGLVDIGEDLNYNGFEDAGEDIDGNGLWEPGRFFDTGTDDEEEISYDVGVQLTTQPSDDIVFFPVDEPAVGFIYPTHFRSTPGARKISTALVVNAPVRVEDVVEIDEDEGNLPIPFQSQPIALFGINSWDIQRDPSFPTELFLNQVIVEFYDQDPAMPVPFPNFDPLGGDLRMFRANPRRDCNSGIALYRDDNAETALLAPLGREDAFILVESALAGLDDTGTPKEEFDAPIPPLGGIVISGVTITDPVEFLLIDSEWIAYTEITNNPGNSVFRVLDDPSTPEIDGRGLFGTVAATHAAGATVSAGVNGAFDWLADEVGHIFIVDDPVVLDSVPDAPTTAVTTDPPAVALLFTGTSEIFTESNADPMPLPTNDIGVNAGNDFFVVVRTGEDIDDGDDFSAGIVGWGYTLPVFQFGNTKRSRALGFTDISPETSKQSRYLYLFRRLFHTDLPEDTRAFKSIKTAVLVADEDLEPGGPPPPPPPPPPSLTVRFAEGNVPLTPATQSQYKPLSQLEPLNPGEQISIGVLDGDAPFTFTLIQNNSGANPLQTLNSVSVLYTAGPIEGVTDVVRVEDSLGESADVSITVTGETGLRVFATGGFPIFDGDQILLETGHDLDIWATGGTRPYTFAMIVNNSNADLVTVKSDAEGVLRVRYTAGDLINQIDTIRVGDANSVPYDLSTYVTFTIKVVAEGSIPTYGWGDVNGDGQLTEADALLIVQIEAGVAQPQSVQHAEAGDVDGDGRLTVLDALYIRMVLAGELPIP